MTAHFKESFFASAAFATYEIGFGAAVFLFAPYALFKMISTPAYRAGLAQRFSFSIGHDSQCGGASPVLIQAVSLGEVKSVAPLLHLISERTSHCVHVTTTTQTGQRVARELLSPANSVSYFPLDFTWTTRRVLEQIRPRAIVLFETEIWPNFIRSASRKNIPVLIVNGRISERSFRYYRLFPWIFRRTLARINRIGMQTGADAERVVALGADPRVVQVCGNMKFDSVSEPPSGEQVEEIRQALSLPKEAILIVGGSTHEGEEAALLKAFQRLRARNPDIYLLLAPRHPERFDDVETLIRNEGFEVVRRSKHLGSRRSPCAGAVFLLDTIGELVQVYPLASIAFVGGSLVDVGGHNIIEPASLGRPVLFGPHMQNFKNIKEHFLSEHAALCVNSAEELYRCMHMLLEQPEEAAALGEAARKVVERNRGATMRYFELLRDFL